MGHNMIKIEGLTRRQRAIADVLWMMEGRDQVLRFVETLNEGSRADARVVLNMMVAVTLDGCDHVEESTLELIDNIRKR